MAKKREKRAYRVKKKRKKIGFWTKLVVVVIVGYFAVAFFQQSVERRELDAEIESLQQEKAEIEERIQGMEEVLEKGDSDEAIERLARENLIMKKPGERVYVMDTNNSLSRELRERREQREEEEGFDGENSEEETIHEEGLEEDRPGEEAEDGEEQGP
ncbi:FtsB family cell division protein [Isachenkonia alkalipeptolytica]|uniref:Septum formation initiator family protein n=1 Tax=Isachenkonia alkalipeptolytica TaxID=2565777 RepID=A0AA44BFW2_9CLOT|nr:septum formation initiator family protein [Isachenkonia alkalipeptolytica]NBG88901.1 septum formation initiator family protein [Isachenkonia alkalipeptolytica]